MALFALATAGASTAAGQEWADKMFKERTHDFRTVGRGAKAEYAFEFTNLYQEEVHVSAVRTSCGCTTPVLSADTLRTHEKAKVTAKFNTNSFIGQKGAVITVVFDKPYYAEVQLNVSGYIRTDVSFDPPEVDFGEMMPGEVKTKTVTITKTGNSNWRITDVRSQCKDLAASLSGPIVSRGQVQYRTTVRSRESLPEGDLAEQLTLVSNDRAFPTTEMAIVGRVRKQLTVTPEAVSIDTVTSDEPVEKRLVVRGEVPFRITDVRCDDDRFEFEIPADSKKLHFLKMRFFADSENGRVAQRIKVVTDLAGENTAELVVTGTVRR